MPLAIDMREPGELPTYGSRMLTAQLSGSGAVFPHSRAEQVQLDERLYPTHAMILACRNPYAAAAGRSRWVVFVAGTRSLGTSGAVLALTLMLRRMRADPEANFYSEVPTSARRVRAPVSAVLVRVAEVEQAVLRRDGADPAAAAAADGAGGAGPALQRQLRADRGGRARVRDRRRSTVDHPGPGRAAARPASRR